MTNPVISNMARRANRLSAFAAFLETYEAPAARLSVIDCLHRGGLISDTLDSVLRETYAGETAE